MPSSLFRTISENVFFCLFNVFIGNNLRKQILLINEKITSINDQIKLESIKTRSKLVTIKWDLRDQLVHQLRRIWSRVQVVEERARLFGWRLVSLTHLKWRKNFYLNKPTQLHEMNLKETYCKWIASNRVENHFGI